MLSRALVLVLLILLGSSCHESTNPIELERAKEIGPGRWPSNNIRLIYDGDVGPDPCDFTTLSMLHEYHRRGMIAWIGVIGATPDPSLATTFRTYNWIYGNDIPIGSYQGGSEDVSYSWTARLMYRIAFLVSAHANANHVIRAKYAGLEAEEGDGALRPVETYRKLLSAAEDDSITIYAAGPLFNFPFLLDSKADSYSPLDGKALLQKKVKGFVFMGGYFPVSSDFPLYSATSGAEYNWWALGQKNVTQKTIERLVSMGKPMTYVGFEVGEKILVGREIVRRLGRDHPTSEAFYQYRATRGEGGGELRKDNPAFDDVALYHLVEGGIGRFFGSVSGRVRIDARGANAWQGNGKAERYLTLLPGVEDALIEVVTDRITGEF